MFSIKYDLPPKGVTYKQWRKQIIQRAIGASVLIFGIAGFLASIFLFKPEETGSKFIDLKDIELPFEQGENSVGIEGTIIAEDVVPPAMFGNNKPLIKGSIILQLTQKGKKRTLYMKEYQSEKIALISGDNRIPLNISPKKIPTHIKSPDEGKISFSNKNGKIIPVKVHYFDTTFVITDTAWNEFVKIGVFKKFLYSGEKVVLSGYGEKLKNGRPRITFSKNNKITKQESKNRIISIIASLVMIVFGFLLYTKGTKDRRELINYSESLK